MSTNFALKDFGSWSDNSKSAFEPPSQSSFNAHRANSHARLRSPHRRETSPYKSDTRMLSSSPRLLLLSCVRQLLGRRDESLSLIHTHGPCPGAPAHQFILPAKLSLSPLKPSLTRCCHNKPTLAVSPQHPPTRFCFSFSSSNSPQHTQPNSQILTPTALPPLFYSHLLIHSSLEATSKPWFIFKLRFSAGVASGSSFLHFIQHFTKSVYHTKLNFNSLMLSAVNKCAQSTRWPALTMFIHIASKSVLI